MPNSGKVDQIQLNFSLKKNNKKSVIFLKGVSHCTTVAECCCGLSKLPSITSPTDNLCWREAREQLFYKALLVFLQNRTLKGIFRLSLGGFGLVLFAWKSTRGLVGVPFWASLLRCSCSCGNSKWSLPCAHARIDLGSLCILKLLAIHCLTKCNHL